MSASPRCPPCRRLRCLLWGTAALGTLLLVSCARATVDTVPRRAVSKAEAVHFVLVATGDWHGEWFASPPSTPGGLPQGGLLAFYAQLSALREAFPGRVLWVDAGDILRGGFGASPQEGLLAADLFSRMGLDFAAVGESDLDFVADTPSEGGEAQEALKASLQRAAFPWSLANVYAKEDGARPVWLGGDALHLVERQGVQVGFVGLVTPSVPLRVHASSMEGLYFGDMALAAEERARALREKGADVVVLVVHAGAGGCASGEASACGVKESEVWKLLEALPEGLVDVVVAGHTHEAQGYFFKGVPVVQPRGLGRHFSLVHLYWEPTERRLLREETRLQIEVPICEKVWPSSQRCEGIAEPQEEAVPAVFFDKTWEVDAGLSAFLEPWAWRSLEAYRRSLGVEVKEPLGLGTAEESALGGAFAEALLQATQAEVALVSRGAFREGLSAGALSMGRLLQSIPWDSRVAVVRLSGEELRRLMRLAYGQTRFLFDVAGVELRLSCFPSGRRRVKAQLVSADGQRHEIDGKASYWVAMPEYLAQGGAGLEGMVVDARPRQTKWRESMREEVAHFWRQRRKPVALPLRPRVLWENEIGSCPSPQSPP